MPLLETILLGKFYPTGEGRVQALRGVSLRVEAGEVVAVVGPPGAGKTTLLNLIAGLDRPTRGVVYVGGLDLGALPRWRLPEVRGRRVSLITRRPHFLPERTVLENVAWPLRYLPKGERRAGHERARRLLARVGLAQRAGARPQTLSPAEAQRAAIARALVAGPLVVLADEPAADLDPEAGRELIALLTALAHEQEAVLLVTAEDAALVPAATQVLRLPEEGIEPLALPGAIPAAPPVGAGEVLSDIYAGDIEPLARPLAPFVNSFLRPALYTLAVAVLITYLCFFGLELAARGRAEVPADVWRVAGASFTETTRYLSRALRGDLGSVRQYGYYYWAEPRERFIRDIVAEGASRSLPLLALALVLAAAIGVPLGLGAALARRSRFSLGFVALAVAGVSAPSFFLAFLLQLGEIAFYRRTGIQLVPLGGFGWDRRVILPALVLAARPIAQVARVSFVALAEVLDADYIRTARAKGLAELQVLLYHALKNASVPILTVLGTSLRFALSSLPVIEAIFGWPGMGQKLLQAMYSYQLELAAGLTLTLGLCFIVVNVALEGINRWVDPRLDGERTSLGPRRSWLDLVLAAWQGILDLPLCLRRLLEHRSSIHEGQTVNGLWARISRIRLASVKATASHEATEIRVIRSGSPLTVAERARDAAIRRERRRAWARHTLGSLPFALGALILLALVAICVLGPRWAPHDPYAVAGSRTVEGVIVSPPFPPSREFPLGTDQQGRDILSLLLVGARRTLTIALFAVLARVALGAILGCLAGWFAGSLLDRALMAAVEVAAAFPALLLAMVVIFALGVKQGMWVFVAGLCAVGWGEAAQFVRGQVLTIREKEYIEGALAVGLGDLQILLRQVLPNLFPSLVVLTFLEMGGAMMLLGELGFIGVFIGGGMQTTNVLDQAVTYFDIPEWGVMLSNTWRTFRSYPWATLYPALAFTIAIVGFNFFGEGLRRLTERLTVNMNRLFNRYTLGAALAVAALSVAAAEGSGPWGRYKAMADRFDAARALADVRALADPAMAGRRSGTPGLDRAADYIAGQFEAARLQPGGELQGVAYTYFQTSNQDYHDVVETPRLALRAADGTAIGPLTYGQDYLEYAGDYLQDGSGQGEVVFAASSRKGYTYYAGQGAWALGTFGRIALVDGDVHDIEQIPVRGVLIIVPRQALARRDLQTERLGTWQHKGVPYLFISEEVADRILAGHGYSLAGLREQQADLDVNEGLTVATGVQAEMSVPMAARSGVPTRNVLALFPGSDDRIDDEAIFVVAHYDGLGRWPDGTLYPGANDNASGVAVMLEAARVLEESGFQPRRSLFFVAWAPAERRQELDLAKMLSARLGFVEAYKISAVIEVRGVGAGTGKGLVLDQASSGRMADVFREAARREGVPITTRGSVLHESLFYPTYGRTFIPMPGRKRLPYLALSWSGSGESEHRESDNVEGIDPQKLAQTGRLLALALMRMAGEPRY